ncbi:MAG: DUF1292 domain-containing protein [Oscillospiraceae bacterium]|nr:DUF1292 domain-containing protein [Oscillospiraceae bacterium]
MDENEMEYSPDLITLEDEDGNEHTFEVIDAADYQEERYLAVVPYSEDPTALLEEDANLILMRICEEDGEEYLDVVEDDEEFYNVGEMFAERLREVYDIDDGEEDE